MPMPNGIYKSFSQENEGSVVGSMYGSTLMVYLHYSSPAHEN